jgi:RHS repeat-associated protein
MRSGIRLSETRSFDRGSRLLSITTAGPGGPIGAMVYTRDENGNPIGVDVSGPAGIIVSESSRNTFDTANRLRKTCYTTTTCTGANQTLWTYNTVGSRLTEKRGTQPVNTYTYDTADQLVSITGPDAKSFSYNPNGDMLTAGSEVFTYNTARQTTSVTVAGQTTAYAYDGYGNRATTTTGATVTSNVWDTVGGLPVLVSERTGGVSQRAYQYVGSTPIRTSSNGAAGWYHGDHVGSITNITGQTGSIEATYRYSPYGTTRSETVTPAFTSNPLKYTGQQQNPGGSYNLRARQYQPTIGSFTQTDPMPYGAGTAFENPYVYAGANPFEFSDVTGLRKQSRAESPWSNLDWDSQGDQILGWWLRGGGQSRSVSTWSDYLERAFTNHRESAGGKDGQEIMRRVAQACGSLLSGRKACRSQPNKSEIQNVAFSNGSGIIGYQYLHGSSLGTRINGVVSHNLNASQPTVSVSITFDDRIDPNPDYANDTKKAKIASFICKLSPCDPTDYDISVTWVQRFTLHVVDGAVVAYPYAALESGPPTGTVPPSSKK